MFPSHRRSSSLRDGVRPSPSSRNLPFATLPHTLLLQYQALIIVMKIEKKALENHICTNFLHSVGITSGRVYPFAEAFSVRLLHLRGGEIPKVPNSLSWGGCAFCSSKRPGPSGLPRGYTERRRDNVHKTCNSLCTSPTPTTAKISLLFVNLHDFSTQCQ